MGPLLNWKGRPYAHTNPKNFACIPLAFSSEPQSRRETPVLQRRRRKLAANFHFTSASYIGFGFSFVAQRRAGMTLPDLQIYQPPVLAALLDLVVTFSQLGGNILRVRLK